MKRVHLVISGEVQGIGFRAWALRYAQGKHLTGWVRNRDDGSVEVVAEGPEEKLEEMIKECHRGPQVAWVAKVEVGWEEAVSKFVNFDIVY